MSSQSDIFSKLANKELIVSKGYINGIFTSGNSNKTFDVNDPSTGELIVKLPDMGISETKDAINAAHKAQKSWAAKTGKERSTILRNWFNLMMANKDDLAKILTAEMGKPLAEALGEITYGASFVEWFAEEAKRVYGDTIPGHQEDKRIVVIKQPIGVVGAITPWNFPNAMITRKVAPALAVGCSVVLRPPTLTPLSALALAYLAQEAGIPAGVFNIVMGTDSSGMGKELCSNELVRKITFTGSTEVGRILMRQCSDQIKKVSLELGGNAPFIVFDDADIDEAVAGAMISKYRNAGQTCVCANRIYVQENIYEEFSKKLAEATRAMKVGNGFDDGVTTGPLIDQQALEKVEEHIEDAVSKGASILSGGTRSNLGGTFYNPTVLTDVTSSMKVAKEETFGPIAPLFKFDSVENVIEAANDTEFGLAAYFYAKDLSKVWKVAEALEYGIVGINTGLISTEVAPFGGIKQSGLGREGSKYGIDDFLEIKYLCMSGI
ncbi:MAG: NAD-dependent succinate-semialdehyde dehydrogenase [Candidatus Puniceispirillales bacterium]